MDDDVERAPGLGDRVAVECAIVGEADARHEGRLRIKEDSPEGQAIVAAEKSGLVISVVET